MYFIPEGSGAPPLVFVHGLCCAHGDWEVQVAHFRVRHDVVACDLWGHSRTPAVGGGGTIGGLGADVAALLADLQYKGAILLGHSMGCRVVIEAERLAPGRVGGLGLLDANLTGMGDRAKAAEFVAGLPREVASRLAARGDL